MSGENNALMGEKHHAGVKDAFRKVCSRFPKGVTVVTAKCSDGEAIGMTVSAFTGVSLDPPTLLICLGKDSRSAQSLMNAQFFAVNVLSEEQRDLSQRFSAAPWDQRFAGLSWSSSLQGPPVLSGNVGHFICERMDAVRNGDHYVIFGRVLEGECNDTSLPLVYWASSYHCLAQTPQASIS